MKKLFLVGGGGHCHSVLDVLDQQKEFQVQGVFDSGLPKGSDVLDIPVLGNDQDLISYIKPEHWFLITVGQIKSAQVRKKLFLLLKSHHAQIATVISDLAHVSKYAKISEGCCIHHQVIVNANAVVGANCILNTKALIEHDAVVGEHCHIATGAVVNGACRIGAESFIGSGAVLKQGIEVLPASFIQAGGFYAGKY